MISNSQQLLGSIRSRTILRCSRNISKYLDNDITSKAIRQNFIDFFVKDEGHTFVRSSPVVPFCDPTVAFVNAGMNQFKGIFLGTHTSEYQKVANYQKCIRVGGKHNDLNVVGTDGYHHTFFEMLGNWSFGSYFKAEACELAWTLLTERYNLNKATLYVTYFGGDEELGLEEDVECKEIWRSIGIPEERILSFGVKDNFWEMGPTGPCGPCSEIHIDLRGTACRSSFVNKGLSDLTELWNIVFIQYNRNADGSIDPLPQNHIDTGMGFERLAAVLQGKMSNYDTDLFENLFTAIYKISKKTPKYQAKFGENDWNFLDTNYRVLADHSRMITACLADGMIPENNQKLRKVIRRVFSISETTFHMPTGLLKELTNYVVESLGHAYPEMERNIKQIHQIIDYEEQLYQSLRKTSANEWSQLCAIEPKLKSLDIAEMPGLIAAYRDISASKTATITPAFGFKLYDTFGLDEESIGKLCAALAIPFDVSGFHEGMAHARLRSRTTNATSLEMLQLLNGIEIPTDDSYKYVYNRAANNMYDFDALNVKIVAVIKNDKLVDVMKPNEEYIFILDKSNFYTRAGGQESDNGVLVISDRKRIIVSDVEKIGNHLLHIGVFQSHDALNVSDSLEGTLAIDARKRIRHMQNHTATHLLNCALKHVKGLACQKGSHVTADRLSLDVGLFGSKLSTNDLNCVENLVNKTIEEGVNVTTRVVDSQMLMEERDVTVIPGEVYPETDIRLIEIRTRDGIVSKEPCCGTHILNTEDLQDFCIVGLRSLGRSTVAITAFAGAAARDARANAAKQLQKIADLQARMQDTEADLQSLQTNASRLKHKLRQFDVSEAALPVVDKMKCLNMLDAIIKQLKQVARSNTKSSVEMELRIALETNVGVTQSNRNFVVHYLGCSMEQMPLQKVTKLCENVPVLIVSYAENVVKARCCVPKDFCNDEFDAEKWLQQSVGNAFKSDVIPPKGEDVSQISIMKSAKIDKANVDLLLNESLKVAKDYAVKHL